ncbi:EAL domain-containing protein [Aliivibrio fischeri]|uniref:EAL domain-containing protein n=1 Tax=Aliivibrio fischeri TaxID=668 RepID=UPI00132C013A|nr:EAL domain-containing protein [Aliivibrio fischeri]
MFFLYQPKVQNGSIVSVEALLRVPGVTNVEKYISMITNKPVFDLSIIKKVLSDRKIYYEELGVFFPVSINISIQSLESEYFVDKAYKLLRNEIDVTLEITENDSYLSLKRVKESMKILKSIGIKFSLDDFGKDFSDIEQVLSLDLDEIKIDGSLVYDIENNFYKFRHLKYTLDELEGISNFNIIIERVENKKQINLIESLGKKVSYQGYYFYKPMRLFDLTITASECTSEKSNKITLLLEKLIYELIKSDNEQESVQLINDIHAIDVKNAFGLKTYDNLTISEVKKSIVKKYNEMHLSLMT